MATEDLISWLDRYFRSGANIIVQEDGVVQTDRAKLNFQAPITVTDDAPNARMNITVAAATALAVGVLQLAGDLTTPATAPKVVGLQGRPVAATAPSTNDVLAWNGSAWAPSAAAGGGAPVDAQYVTLATNGTLTNERVLTQGSAITLTDGGAGSTLTVAVTTGGILNAHVGAAAAIVLSKLADGSACSVVGRSANSSGAHADIAAAANDRVLVRKSDAIAFDQIVTDMIQDAQITDAKLRLSAGVSVIGRAANTIGAVADITAGADDRVLGRRGGALTWATIATAEIADSAVTVAKLANLAGLSVLGRSTNSTGAVAAITSAATAGKVLVCVSGTSVAFADPNFGALDVTTTGGVIGSYGAFGGANVATTGQVRLRNDDSIYWRNGANTANVQMLTLNGSNNAFLGDDAETNILTARASGGVILRVASAGRVHLEASGLALDTTWGTFGSATKALFLGNGTLQATNTSAGGVVQHTTAGFGFASASTGNFTRRATETGITTTDGTATLLRSFTIPTGSSVVIRARVRGHKVLGTDHIYYERTRYYVNVGGTVSRIDIDADTAATEISFKKGEAATDGYAVTWVINGTAVEIKAAGAASDTVKWQDFSEYYLAAAA